MHTATAPAAFRIQVLGPLTVSDADGDLDLGGPKQRLVLALLLVDLDQMVTTRRLIEGLWGEDPPPTARKAVHVHVSNLRRSLGAEFPLRTAPGGYLLQSTGLDIDAVAFERELDAARARLRTDPLLTVRSLVDANARWRGSPYFDLCDEPGLAAEVARLEELRLRALEVRLDGQLRIGRHADAAGELATLCLEHPYRERFAELSMLALYRSGRQTEALRAYDRTRSVLVEDLGVEPGPALQALHREILEQSPKLDLDESDAADHYAFLATDIEGSTTLWEHDAEAMQAAVARHDELLAEAVAANSGTVFKATGDGIYAVFASASEALQAGVDAQQALDAEPWPTSQPILVRMAVDEGAASSRGGDYFGPALGRVSRIMSSGHGGQLLCPADLAAQATVPTRNLGVADYKGIGRLDVVQVDVPGLPLHFPDLQTHRTPKPLVREGFGRAIRGYELRERLGGGAHGVVYRAYQPSIGREVAIKVIRPDHACRPAFVKRFEAEAQFVAQLEHPHIVSLHDYWRDPDGAYLVMQLLRGGSLATSLERAPWRPPAALQLLDQVGGALDYAHRQGVIHRDLKPANVLLDGDGNAYLSDFGIASEHLEAVGVPVGSSVAYVSPEELAGDRLGPATDMYGLALLTNEILTGERPALGQPPPPISERRPDLPPGLDAVIGRAADLDPAKRFDRIDDFLRALRQVFGADVVTTPRHLPPSEVRNPFKGLRAFGEVDAHDYFGREALVRELLDHVATHRFTAVVGPSGSGKSSLVRAGLLPALRRRASDGPGDVVITDMFPGSFPFEELEAALLRVAVGHQEGLLSELVADDRGLLRMSKRLLPDDDSELVLVIDQFEELFLLTHDDEARRLFLANLVTATADGRGRVRVVVTLRADHFDRPLADPVFGALLRTNLVTVAMPTHDELTRAISQPAAGAGLDFEPGLIPRIVEDVADQPGALPLLQHALTELVRARTGAELTRAAYDSTGRVAGALTARAEEIHEGLTPAAREAAREVFLRLVAVDDAGDDTRRRVRRSELESLGLGERALDAVLDGFGSFRLLSFDRDPLTRGPTVEVAHEALIREWPRLRSWIDERREDLLLERRLEAACNEWEDNARDPSFLFAGGQLDRYEHRAEATDLRLTAAERDFLDESRRADDEARTARRRRRRGVVGALALLAVVAVGAAVLAVAQRNAADDNAERAIEAQRREARGRAVSDARLVSSAAIESSTGDPGLGLLLSVAASDLLDSVGADTPEAMEALYSTTRSHRALHELDLTPVTSARNDRQALAAQGTAPEFLVASDPAGERLAVVVPASEGGGSVVEIVDLETGDLIRRVDEVADPVSVLWDPTNGRLLVGATGGLTSVDLATGETTQEVASGELDVYVLDATQDHLTYVAYRPSRIATGAVAVADDQMTSVILDRATRETHEYPDSWRVSLSPAADRVAVYPDAATTTATIETFPSGRPIPTDAPDKVTDWTPNGHLLALDEHGEGGPALEEWSLDAGRLRRLPLEASTPRFFSGARLSPDGRWIAVSAGQGAITILDASTFEPLEDLVIPGPQGLGPLTWSGDSRRLISVDDAGHAVVWELAGSGPTPASAWTGSGLWPAFFSRLSGDRLLVGADSGAWELWNTATGLVERAEPPARPPQEFGRLVVLADPDRVVAPQGAAASMRIDDLGAGPGVETTAIPGQFDTPLAADPDGHLLAVAMSLDGSLVGNGWGLNYGLVDLETGATVVERNRDEVEGVPVGAAFSPDGRLAVFALATAADAGSVDQPVFDVRTGEEIARIEVSGGAASVGFSPDGRLLSIGGFGRLELHDVDAVLDGRDSLLTSAVTGHGDDPLTSPTFTEDATIVVAGQRPAFGEGDSWLTAWSTDGDMRQLWSLRMAQSVNRIEVGDGLVWMPAQGGLPPAGSTDSTGVIGIPIDRRAMADFARSKTTRSLTEDECRRYLFASCDEFSARLD